MHSPREHFHTYLQSLDVERGGPAGASSATKLARVLRHYGVDEPRPHAASSRRRCSGSSSPSSARRPRSRWPPRCSSAGSPSRPRSRRSTPPRRERARPARRRHPAALPGRRRPRPQRPLPLVRPAARRRRPRPSVLGGVRRRASRRSPPMPDGADARRADRRARRHPRADRAVPRRAARGRRCPSSEPMLEVLIKRHYREHELHRPARASCRRAARSPSPTTPSTTARPTWSSTVGTVDELAPDSALVAAVSAELSSAARRATQAVVDLYLSWPEAAGRRRRTPAPGSRALLEQLAVRAATCGASPSRSAPARPAARALLHLPADRRRRSSRTGWSAACTRWSDAASTCGGCATST